MDRREWRDITEDTNSLVLILHMTGRAVDRREWTDITEDTNSLVPILLKTGTAMDGRYWTDIIEDRNRHGPKRMTGQTLLKTKWLLPRLLVLLLPMIIVISAFLFVSSSSSHGQSRHQCSDGSRSSGMIVIFLVMVVIPILVM